MGCRKGRERGNEAYADGVNAEKFRAAACGTGSGRGGTGHNRKPIETITYATNGTSESPKGRLDDPSEHDTQADMNAETTIKKCCERAVAALYGNTTMPELQVSKTRKEFAGDYTLVTFPLLRMSRG